MIKYVWESEIGNGGRGGKDGFCMGNIGREIMGKLIE